MAIELLTFVKGTWVKPLWKILQRVSGARAKELNRLRDDFVDPQELARYYVEPHLQDRNPADGRQDDRFMVARQSAFDLMNNFLQGDPPLEKDGRHQMFILSDAGMGKTSLLLMVKLMHFSKLWPPGHGCELFKLGNDTLERMAAIPKKGETVLLLDALDEDPRAWKRIRERLLELLAGTEDFRRVIISSRTQFFPDMESDDYGRPEIKVLDGYHCPVLYLSPFNNEQVVDFIDKKLPLRLVDHLFLRSKRIRAERQRAHHLINQMDSLRMRPMLLAHIDKLLAIDDRRSWNGYTVYEAMIQKWLDREVITLKKLHRGRERVPGRPELFKACVRVAQWMSVNGTRVISEDQLAELITENRNIAWLEKFELGGRSLLNRNSDKAFRFSHYTIQEFLLALLVMNGSFNHSLPVRATDQLVRFIDLAGGFPGYLYRLDFTGFSLGRYVKVHGPMVMRAHLGGGLGPEMLMLPAGRFRKEKTQLSPEMEVKVRIFAMGRYLVTFEEFDLFCAATKRAQPKDEGWGRERRPVINISWHDAMAYCQWLSKETGQPFRLPTEDEWEYACRAGSETAYCFGDDQARLVDYAWYDKNSAGKTHPVGEKFPNNWGIHDMHGNVWEWCYDRCDSDCGSRVLRGGSWLSPGGSARSACRDSRLPALRYSLYGFRLACGHM